MYLWTNNLSTLPSKSCAVPSFLRSSACVITAYQNAGCSKRRNQSICLCVTKIGTELPYIIFY